MTPEQIKLKLETEENLLGDTRERLLGEAKRFFKWSDLPERRQRDCIAAFEQIAREMIRDVFRVTIGRGHRVIPVAVSSLKEGKEHTVESKITADATEENVLALFRAGQCVLVPASAQVFMGERAPSEVMLDQPELPVEGDGEGDTVKQNTELLEEGINQLETEGPTEDPPHDPETGEVLEEQPQQEAASPPRRSRKKAAAEAEAA